MDKLAQTENIAVKEPISYLNWDMSSFFTNQFSVKSILLWIVPLFIITQSASVLKGFQISAGDSSSLKTESIQSKEERVPDTTIAVDTREQTAVTDQVRFRNAARFESKRNLFRKVVGIPRAVWTLAFYPLGQSIIWGERIRIDQRATNFFLNDDRTAGVLPLLTVGGNTGTALGSLIFNNDLFHNETALSGYFLYNSPENLVIGSNFSAPVLSNRGTVYASVKFWEDEEEFLFDIGNNTSTNDSLAYGVKEKYMKTGFEYTWLKSSGRFITTNYHRERKPGRMNFISIDTYIKYRTVTIDAGKAEFRTIADKVTGYGEESSIEGGISFSFDSRNRRYNPFKGGLFRLSGILSDQLNGDEFGFLRYTFEFQRYFQLFKRGRIIAVRAILDETHTPGDKVIPFYDMSVLGNAKTLRGYREGRFRDFGSALINIEYRYPIWDSWDGVFFLDQGEVFTNLSDLSVRDFHTGYGFGIRVRTMEGFLARAQVGRSKEGTRFILQFSQIFD